MIDAISNMLGMALIFTIAYLSYLIGRQDAGKNEKRKKLKIKEARNYAECEYGRQYGELASAGREECLVYAGVRSYIILTRRARRSCRLFGIPSAERSCVNCAYVDLLHYQPPCNNCLRSPYAVHGETTDDAWKPTGKWQIP